MRFWLETVNYLETRTRLVMVQDPKSKEGEGGAIVDPSKKIEEKKNTTNIPCIFRVAAGSFRVIPAMSSFTIIWHPSRDLC
jgi:hypothetical protein